ncbi:MULTISPECIES: protein phosphatase 2C domain-containing protein [Streptomyces]|uniref:protein phosphatase 2C domain-containing protein n=1 Tax=Streptomyces TaxID=1883 RepID=UPI0015D4B9BC|nr:MULTISPECIES: protein phosphatase 2C domain-containing protein [Streptomyces]MCX4656039.1 protein phosphatase 2C domain-containing protein [Streptomyces microflavus]
MSQQGEKPAAHEDDWWRKLYDETAPDTGPSSAPDSLDDRFDSVSDTVSTAVGRQRATGRETAEDAYGGPDPVPVSAPELRPEPLPLPQQDEELRAEPWEEPKPEPEEPRAEPTPDPRSGWDLYRGPEPDPDPEPYGRSQPVPEPHRGQEPEPYREPEPYPFTASASAPTPAAVPGPRSTVFPAPWEAPAGPPGPRTFAVPKPPEPEPPPAPPVSATATVPDPGALHEPSPDWAASDAPADGGGARPLVDHLGDRPPTYDAEPAALPAATSENLDTLVPDTVLDGARYGTYTLRAASVRGDSARFRGEPRRDALLTTRFGAAESALVLVAVAGGVRAGEGAHLAAADACRWIGGAVARSHARLSEDIRAGRRADLKSGLHRLTDRTYGKLRARAAELGLEPGEYTTSLRCLLLSADPACRTRVFFGVGSGGLFRLRDGLWQDLEPTMPEVTSAGGGSEESPDGDRLTMDLQITTPPSPYSDGPAPPPAEVFRFRASVARPGDTLLLCSNGLAEPMRGEPELPAELAERWGAPGPPGLPAFLADTQLRIKGYADDRTCAAVWEA